MNLTEFFIEDINRRQDGLYVIHAPMFGNKSSFLIAAYWDEKNQGKNPIAFNYFGDTRFGENSINSHNQHLPLEQRSCPAYQINSIGEALEIINNLKLDNSKPQTFIFDEVNLLDEGIIDFCKTKKDLRNKVIVAGLKSSFRGEPFQLRKWQSVYEKIPQEHDFSNLTMDDLIKIADRSYALNGAICNCGNIANNTQRLLTQTGTPAPYNSPLMVIGAGKDLNPEHDYYYEPRCDSCFVKPI